MAVVLFPTPPFWFTMATTVATAGILARLLHGLLQLCTKSLSGAQQPGVDFLQPQYLVALPGFAQVTSPLFKRLAAVFSPVPLSAETYLGLRRPYQAPPADAPFARVAPGTSPLAPRATLPPARARRLPLWIAPPPAMAPSSQGWHLRYV